MMMIRFKNVWRPMVGMVVFFLMVCVSIAGAETAPTQTVVDAESLLKQVDKKLHPDSFESYYRIINRLPNGRKKIFTLYSAQNNHQAVALIVSPDVLRGRAVLRLNDQVWLHIPGEIEPRQGTLGQSLVGGVLNNADLLLTNYSELYTATLLEEKSDSYLLQLIPKSQAIPYAKLIMRVNRKLMVPQTVSHYSARGTVLKTIHFKKISSISGLIRPHVLTTASDLNKKYISTKELGRISPRKFPENTFDKAFLSTVGTLLK